MVDLIVVIFGLRCIIIFTSEKVIVMENPIETKLVILRKANSKKNKPEVLYGAKAFSHA